MLHMLHGEGVQHDCNYPRHCQSLALAGGVSESTREANWNWAGTRACDSFRRAGPLAKPKERTKMVGFFWYKRYLT